MFLLARAGASSQPQLVVSWEKQNSAIESSDFSSDGRYYAVVRYNPRAQGIVGFRRDVALFDTQSGNMRWSKQKDPQKDPVSGF